MVTTFSRTTISIQDDVFLRLIFNIAVYLMQPELSVQTILIGSHESFRSDGPVIGLVGDIAHFAFNGISFITKFPFGENYGYLSPFNSGDRWILEATAHLYTYDTREFRLSNLPYPINFKNRRCHLKLPGLRINESFNVSFALKTQRDQGILFLNIQENPSGFFALEIVRGLIHVVFNLNSGGRTLKLIPLRINDFKWHTIEMNW